VGRLIRIAPVAYGYGPIGKAQHIARALRSAMSFDVQLELIAPQRFAASCEPGLFDAVGAEPSADHADVVVSVMNEPAVLAATGRGERVVFVDSLAWLWEEPLPAAQCCDCYLYQELPFLPVPSRNLTGMRAVRPIDAIGCPDFRPAGASEARASGQVVVSVAGVENFEVSLDSGNAWYAKIILDALDSMAAADRDLAARTVVYGNRAAINWAAPTDTSLKLGSGKQSHFLAAALHAKRVLTSPGLTTLVELLPSGVPISLLPPQNYSQVRIASALRCAGVEVPQLPWDSPVPEWLAAQTLPEVIGTQIMRNLICDRYLEGGLDPAALRHSMVDDGLGLTPADVTRVIGEVRGAAQVAEVVANHV
jgi:hypothetical protein